MSHPFTIIAQQDQARAGLIQTQHDTIETPAFLPCATHGALRGVGQPRLAELDYQALLANAYHLYLRPGIDTIEQLGGLHAFMGWERAILTDSGGFQAFALPKFVRYEADGIHFRSHIDGSEHFFTPELVVAIQERLGVDLATCLDVCTGFPVPEVEVARAVNQTNEWAARSIKARRSTSNLLYGMVQGSIYPEQRRRSAEFLGALPFDGFAIGGNMYTFGATIAELESEKPQMWETVAYTTSLLPSDKPRHLLGVGEPADLIAGVAAGIDTFDCVMATRMARHGSVWLKGHQESDVWSRTYDRINLSAARWKVDSGPLEETCGCSTCTGNLSRGYLHHLLRIRDPLVGQLLAVHNLWLLRSLMGDLRSAILSPPLGSKS